MHQTAQLQRTLPPMHPLLQAKFSRHCGGLSSLRKQAQHKVLKGHQITERAPMDLIETVRKLNRIGINLNQLAWEAHSLNYIDTKAYWENVEMVQDTIRVVMEEIRR